MKKQLIILFLTTLISIPSWAAKKKNNSKEFDLIINRKCFQCHKPNNSLNAPRLHGADEKYLIKQLKKFKTGQRENVFMKSIASTLSETEIVSIAKYFSKLDPCAVKGMGQENILGNAKAGAAKAASCIACHAPGNPMEAPILDGQNFFYLQRQLLDMKFGKRKNDYMQSLVQTLSEEDINNLSAFYAANNKCKTKKKSKEIPRRLIWVKLPYFQVSKLQNMSKDRKTEVSKIVEKALKKYFKKKK